MFWRVQPKVTFLGAIAPLELAHVKNKKQDRMVNSSGLEKIYTLTDGRTGIQKSDLYSEVGLAKKCILYPNFWSTSLNILEKLIRKAKNLKKAIGTGFMLFKYPSLAYFSLWMLKIENINLHPKSYNFSESFDTFWELQPSCLMFMDKIEF